MSEPTQNDQIPVNVSERAVARVQKIKADDGNDHAFLRVYVEGGGCSGFQYGFQLDATDSEDDIRIEREGVTVVVDPMSLQYLIGANIDYLDDLMGARFVVNNPNASTTCGCGSSFSI